PTVVPVTPTSNKNSIIIAFSDMWLGFNYNNNFIIDSLRHETKSLGLDITGINYIADSNPNLLIFGPYSHTWTTIPDTIPKVYFSSENWTKPNDPRITLYMTSAHDEDDTHIRIPTWMMYIDWYSNATTLPENCEDNPIRLPIHFAITPHPIIFKDRTEFCGFVVSNPVCSLRNETFKAINDYKKVNSGGTLYNNIGGQLSLKYPGGGCGDISKHQFFSKQQFSISFENSQAPGYITEKVLHAKMAGCVPLYWGDKDTNTDFVNGSIVNLSIFNNPEQILEVIKKLELNPDLCAKIASTPILNEEKKQTALNVISKMSQKLLTIANINHINKIINKTPLTHLKNIDKVFVVNLDTRKDRWDTLCKEEPFITSIAERVSAVNGRTLKLTPYIYSLFKNNNFNWKKSVMGCNLSHINIWTKILSQKTGNLFLILEDDVRFIPSQLSTWDKYAETIPSDAELVYIGGVLPPNRPGLNSVIEPINDFWGKIKPNRLFTSGQLVPLFHFCTYSYIISRRAVEKLIEHLINSENKMPNVIDHFLGFHSLNLKTYVANPLITKCFQDDDPIYQNAIFNNTGTIAQFDSDIRNNTECFSNEELEALKNPYKAHNITTLYHISDMKMPIYEHNWITDIFSEYTLKKVDNLHNFIEDDMWFIVQRPYSDILNTYFNNLPKNITFKVLHLSDEFDPVWTTRRRQGHASQTPR
ncbi:MAG: glycosyltransferase family 25 protein, partial [Alphaproteobacteria bacterium]